MFSSYNIWTKNARKLIKGPKGSDSSLDSKKSIWVIPYQIEWEV